MCNDDFIILNRIGYGSNFNKLSVNFNRNIIKKESINKYGDKKINYEINFYRFLINNEIFFRIPKIYDFERNSYTMEYFNNYEPLYKIFNVLNNFKKTKLINEIKNNLNILHNSSTIYISKDDFFLNLKIEIEEKIIMRYNKIKDIIKKYDYIKKVNNIKILDFYKILYIINTKIYKLFEIKYKDNYYLTPFHGDCQFNNILYNIDKDDFIFIDPRGYFGNSEIYGILEYDYSKLLFALSGYDDFDNRNIDKLDIDIDNIKVIINSLDESIFQYNNLEILLMYNIWLGNSECFMKNNEIKGIYSYFISMYLATIFINKNM